MRIWKANTYRYGQSVSRSRQRVRWMRIGHLSQQHDVASILSHVEERVIGADYTIRHERQLFQNVLVGDAGIHQRRATQWGSVDRPADRPAPGKCICSPAAGSEDDLCASRLWVLLRGSGGSLPGQGRAVHHLSPEDVSFGGRTEGRRLAGLTAYGRRRTMRVSLSAGGMGKAHRFLALRYQKQSQPSAPEEPQQYQLFDTPEYRYRVFVTNMTDAIYLLVWF